MVWWAVVGPALVSWLSGSWSGGQALGPGFKFAKMANLKTQKL